MKIGHIFRLSYLEETVKDFLQKVKQFLDAIFLQHYLPNPARRNDKFVRKYSVTITIEKVWSKKVLNEV